ncbi:hypothetical protein HZS_2860 [Henneguya salminicola]|uniref:CD63 antigen (Trinotate prediction) n=1 Tax=Henneguya salminicola TaxID=69463 RepID=A0A6G3MG58_HENSL|nr:hypothetical protein HZS_2860 [Henneguya salminicola]
MIRVEKEPGIYVEQKKSKIISVLFSYILLLGLLSFIIFGVSLTIICEKHYLHGLFQFTDPWDIAWILFCAGVVCLTGFIIGVLFYNSSNPIYLIVYCVCLVLAMVLLIATLWTSAVFYQKFPSRLHDDFLRVIHTYRVPRFGSSRRVVDDIQTSLQCCGLNNHTDWLSTAFYLTINQWPDSCCLFRFKQVYCGDVFSLIYQYKGCSEELYNDVKTVTRALIGTSAAGAIIVLLGWFLLIALFNKSKKKIF